MKILDRYILKNFLLDFLICLVTLMALCVIVETFEKASEFAEYFGDQKKAGEPMQRSPFQAIGRYYLLHLPILYGQVSPIILLMAAMFTVTRMGRYGEFIPIKASGISLYRVLLPILIVGVVLSGISVVIQEKVGIKWLGRRFFLSAPIHHHFQSRGLADTKIVIRFWIVAGILALAGLATLKIR